MAHNFETFLSFIDAELADSAAEKLKASNIEFIVESSAPLLDKGIIGAPIDPNIHIKLRPTDFQRGHKALEDYYRTQLDHIDEDYYLLSFSNEELKDIIMKPDEWGHFDYMLALKLLKERGHVIDENTVEKLKGDRIRELAQPDKASKALLFFGYCFIPFGVIIGFFIGRHLFYSRKMLPMVNLFFLTEKQIENTATE